jgi:hypothetical protein
MSRPAGSFADYWSRVSVSFKGVWPGLALTAMVAAAADFVSSTYGGPVMLLALLMGMALNFTTEQERVAAGVTFASKKILRIGVALLGLRITFADVVALGAQTVELVTAGVVVTILFGVLTARLLGKDRSFGVLVGGATAICGASAALAISSMLPRKADSGNDVIFTVVAVTAFSTAAMVIYPALFSAFGFADREIGVLIGATIHDVAQVRGLRRFAGGGRHRHRGETVQGCAAAADRAGYLGAVRVASERQVVGLHIARAVVRDRVRSAGRSGIVGNGACRGQTHRQRRVERLSGRRGRSDRPVDLTP